MGTARPTDLWAEEGPGRAAAMVAAVDARKVEGHIRLVALDPATVKSPAPLPSALPDALPALTRGEVASWVEEGPEAWIFTVVPLVEVAQEQLRHANRLISVGRLASGVIHELGTPLTVISARARMIGSGELDGDEVSDNARIIDEATGRITGILRRMLDFSRAGRQPPAPVDLAALAGEAAVLLAPLARKHQAVLRVEPGERPITALGDPNELLQAITNLVLNAMQAMPQGGGVTLTPGRRTGPGGEAQVTLSVSDEGQGIAATDLPRLFTPFFTTKTTGQGTGLGLSVSHDILLAHGGTIEVESTSGEGSRFTLVLPAHTPAEAPCADAS